MTYKVRLVSGRTYVIRANGKSTRAGTLVDPFLVLGRVSDNNFITDNDNGGQGLSAKLTYTPTTTENFLHSGIVERYRRTRHLPAESNQEITAPRQPRKT